MSENRRLPDRFQLVSLETVGSTNDEAKRLANETHASDGTLVWSLEQTAGKGRDSRHWISKPGNLYTSIILRPKTTPTHAAQLSFVIAVAVASALEEVGIDGDRLQFKWPNDVLLDDRKVSGILLEAEARSADDIEWVIAGCGINLAHCPAETQFPATSVAEATGHVVTPTDMLPIYGQALANWLNVWETSGFGQIRDNWLSRGHGLNAPIEVRLARDAYTGIFTDLDEEGALILNCDGSTRRITAGDVYFGHSLGTVS